MQSTRANRVTKSIPTPRRANRRIAEEQLAAHLSAHGNTGDEHYGGAATAIASAISAAQQQHQQQHHGGMNDTLMGDDYKDEEGDGDGDAEAEPDPEHGSHVPHVNAMEVQQDMPLAPMDPTDAHHVSHGHHHHHHHQNLDSFGLQGPSGLDLAAAAAAVRDFTPPVGSTIPAPQPLVAATDFQPNPPPPPQPSSQPLQAPSPSLAPQASPHHEHPNDTRSHTHRPLSPSPRHKTTEQMAHESGYEGFKVDSAFAKRMSRDRGMRVAEQRRHGQDLNLVRRSNVEALFAQIAGTEAANPCTHCRKGQGPWTVCVVYNGQMMGSCANCWFNASGSRCSFHEKSQPVQPAAHPYAVTVPIAGPITAAASNTGGDLQSIGGVGGSGPAGPASAFVTGSSPAQLQAAALWDASCALFSHDAGVKGTLQSALLQVRQATPYQRALIQVEVAAKTLALRIAEAEELAGQLGPGEHEGQDQDDGQDQDHQMNEYDSPPVEDSQGRVGS